MYVGYMDTHELRDLGKQVSSAQPRERLVTPSSMYIWVVQNNSNAIGQSTHRTMLLHEGCLSRIRSKHDIHEVRCSLCIRGAISGCTRIPKSFWVLGVYPCLLNAQRLVARDVHSTITFLVGVATQVWRFAAGKIFVKRSLGRQKNAQRSITRSCDITSTPLSNSPQLRGIRVRE